MMSKRLELHEKLCSILGSRHVYFQPPESVKMVYPAIIYSFDTTDNTFANNNVYKQKQGYKVTIADKNPESEISEIISKLPTARMVTPPYVSDNINHFVYHIFY